MKYGLIGEKLGHSFSVPIHKAFHNPEYGLKEIPKDEVDAFMEAKDFRGLNVTIPYKQTVMPHCILDDAAKEIGAVNTIVNKDGVLYGYNTDAFGLSAMMDLCMGEENVDFAGKNAVIIGAGGTAKTATYVLKSKHVKSVTILARNIEKATSEMDGKDVLIASSVETPEEILADTDILVNTTPVGMFPNADAVPVDLDKFRNLSCVFDVVYNPLCTKLVAKAREKKIPAANGLFMLVMQALKAELLFREANVTGYFNQGNPTFSDGKKVYEDLLNSLTNVVLIGMPGCGKSTLGQKLATVLSRDLIDTDEEFIKNYGISPAECITASGEDEFRKKETETVKRIAAKNGLIIATGGGVVTREENISALKQNGKIVYLKRNIGNLSSEGRPLSQGDGAIEKLFEKRKALYENSCDYVAEIKENNPDGTADEILKELGLKQ